MTIPISHPRPEDPEEGDRRFASPSTAGPHRHTGGRETPRPRIRLTFQGHQDEEDEGVLFGFARFLGLDVWGRYLLNRRAAREMGSAALLLVVVLTFELLAWTLLFNVLVHSAGWRLSSRSFLALLLGGVFATGVFLFEKSFITSDFTDAPFRKAMAYGIRLLIIGGSALATAQPVELLVFGGAIESRLHEETVLAEAVSQVEEVKKLEEQARPKSEGEVQKGLDGTRQSRDLDSAKTARDEQTRNVNKLSQQLQDARVAVSRAQNNVEYWTRKLVSAKGRDESERARLSLDAARSRKTAASQAVTSLDAQLREAQADLQSKETSVGGAQKDWDALVEKSRKQATTETQQNEIKLENRKEWMRRVQGATPGEPIPNPDTGRVLQPKPADFTDRLRVLDDLRNARPPLWPPSSDEVRTRAVELFGLDDVDGTDSVAKQRLRERWKVNADLFRDIYRVAFIMACVIPLLTIAFKLLMAGELRDYYSTRAQALAGNPAALQVIRARGLRARDLYTANEGRRRWWQVLRRRSGGSNGA